MKATKPATVRRFKFVGDGLGVPGLPHEISDEDADRSGRGDLLRDAIANGNYIAIEEAEHGGDTSIQ